MLKFLTDYLHFLQNFLFDTNCLICNKFLKLQDKAICNQCMSDLEQQLIQENNQMHQELVNQIKHLHHQTPYFDQVYAYWYYEENIQKLIQAIKYRKQWWLFSILKPILLNAIWLDQIADCNVMIPIPLSFLGYQKRQYNQSELFANTIKKQIKVPLRKYLKKRKHLPSQTQLSRKDRLTKPIGAFKMRSLSKVAGRKVLLVDDVITTGTTLHECSRILKNAGAKEVIILALAIRQNHTQEKNKIYAQNLRSFYY